MNVELREKYADIRQHGTLEEKLSMTLECAEMEEDRALCRVARYELGKMFLDGEGVDKDKEQAVEILKSAAELGSVKAMELVGSLLIADGFIEEGNAYLQKAEKEKSMNEIAGNIATALKRLGRM